MTFDPRGVTADTIPWWILLHGLRNALVNHNTCSPLHIQMADIKRNPHINSIQKFSDSFLGLGFDPWGSLRFHNEPPLLTLYARVTFMPYLCVSPVRVWGHIRPRARQPHASGRQNDYSLIRGCHSPDDQVHGSLECGLCHQGMCINGQCVVDRHHSQCEGSVKSNCILKCALWYHLISLSISHHLYVI